MVSATQPKPTAIDAPPAQGDAPAGDARCAPRVEPDHRAEVAATVERYAPAASPARAAVLVGAGAGSALPALRELAPDVRDVLVLDPDLGAASALEPAVGVAERPRVRVGAVGRAGVGHDTDAYLEIADFLVTLGLSLRDTLLHVPQAAEARARDRGLVAAARDLFFGHSREFRGLFAKDIPGELFLTWACHLAHTGQPFHAVQFFEDLRASYGLGALPPEAARLATSCWIQLHGYAHARRWLPAQGDAATRAAFEGELVTADEIRSSVASECFAQNLEAIERFDPELAGRLRAHRPSEILHIALSDETPWYVQVRRRPHVDRIAYPFIFSLVGERIDTLNPIGDLSAIHRCILGSECYRDSVLVGSLKALAVACAVMANPVRSNMPNLERPIHFLEADLDYLHTLIHAIDVQHLFSKATVWHVGQDADDQFLHWLDARRFRQLPALQLHTRASLTAALVALQERRNHRYESRLPLFDEVYGPAWHRELPGVLRREGSRPPRVLFYTTFFSDVLQYCCEDLRRAFAAIGVEARVLKEGSSTERLDKLGVVDELLSFRPDVVVNIDHIRPEHGFFLPPQLPYVCWIQDELPNQMDPRFTNGLGPRDLTFCIFGEQLDDLRRAGHPHVFGMPLAANPVLYRPIAGLPPPANEVLFPNNIGPPQSDPPEAPGLMAWLTQAFSERGIVYNQPDRWNRLHSLLAEGAAALCAELSEVRVREVARFLIFGHESQFHRKQTVRWLTSAGIPVALYGRGWELDPEFAPYWRGTLKQGEELCRRYQQSKVVLNVTSNLSMHPRVLEGICSGTLVVTRALPNDHVPGCLADGLAIGREILTFASQDELCALASRAFVDEAWRQEVIAAGRERVLADHTYVRRAEQILDGVLRVVEADPQG
jgi:hypothetical protein